MFCFKLSNVGVLAFFTALSGLSETKIFGTPKKLLVVINFFASWCNPCRAEFPAIEEAYREYSDTVEVFALSTEPTDTNANLKLDFVNRYNLSPLEKIMLMKI